jgi:hypothetical protein
MGVKEPTRKMHRPAPNSRFVRDKFRMALRPTHFEPVEGELAIRAPKGLRLYKKATSSGEMQEVAASYRQDRYVIALTKSLRTYWLLLKP